MIKIRRSHDRLIFIMEITIPRKTVFILRRGPVENVLPASLLIYAYMAYITMIVTEVLVPNWCQVISKHHANSIVHILLHELYCITHMLGYSHQRYTVQERLGCQEPVDYWVLWVSIFCLLTSITLYSLSLTHWGRDKWPPFRRRPFQMHFLEWKCVIFAYDFTEVCC